MIRERVNEKFTNASSKMWQHPEHIQNLLEGKPTIPISVEVDLTYICGDGCDYCHFAYTHEAKLKTPDGQWDSTKVMTTETADEVFKKLSLAGVRSVVFSGGGEPLDSPLALQNFKLARSYGLELGMYTRGYGLRGEVADFVADNFEWVVVSLDVSNGDDHEQVKGTSKKVFERKVENIINFAERSDRHANISVSFMTDARHIEMVDPYDDQRLLFGSRKITRLERDMFWMLRLGTDEVQVRPIVDTGTYNEQFKDHHMHGLSHKTSENIWTEHYSHIPQIVEILENYDVIPRLNTSIDKFKDLYLGTSGFEVCQGMSVSAGLIRTDGTVDKCVNTRKITPIGNILEQSVEEIYLNPNLDRAVDGNCRAGCRGCKVNTFFEGLRRNGTPSSPTPITKHPNFI